MLSLEEKATALQHTKLFKYAEKTDLLVLAEHLHEESYNENDIIFNQGEDNDTAFLVIEGRVNIFIDQILMAHYDFGQIFGELSMLDGSPYTASAVAVNQVKVLRIPAKVLFRAFHETENLSVAIIKSLCKRLKRHLLV
ncbi:cyclic nucleotide-binding domain-containing protein [bacterium]|nr:MAG: cyclic nucleotide-binding domain-containing protein [bacterium]